MKVLLTLYGEEKVDLESTPDEIQATFDGWAEFGEAAGAADRIRPALSPVAM